MLLTNNKDHHAHHWRTTSNLIMIQSLHVHANQDATVGVQLSVANKCWLAWTLSGWRCNALNAITHTYCIYTCKASMLVTGS